MKNRITSFLAVLACVVTMSGCSNLIYELNVKETCATPEFSVTGGAVDSGTEVEIHSATTDATIYYTLDGTKPTASSTKYTDKITITKDVIIKAIAVKEEMNNSDVAKQSYTVKTYTIIFANGGHGTAPEAISGKAKGEAVTLPAALTADGYTFEKWNDGTTDYDAGSSYTVSGDVTFTAKWTEINNNPGGDNNNSGNNGDNNNSGNPGDNTDSGNTGDNNNSGNAGDKNNSGNTGNNNNSNDTKTTKETVKTPAFSVTDSAVDSGTTVEITCGTTGATIYYTLDDTTPTTASTKYTGAITITPPMTIKAIAVKTGMTDSVVAKKSYTVKTYTITFANGGYGTAPEAISEKAKGDVITLPKAITLTGYTFEKWTDGTSDYDAEASYTVTGDITFTAKWKGIVASPSFSVTDSAVDSGTTVEITCGTTGATIYYTLDGTTPTTASTKYTGTITITKDVTIKAIAVKTGMTGSTAAEKSYTVKTYTITFANGGHGTATSAFSGKVKGDVITLPAALTETGYTFEKWTVGTTDYDAGSSYTVTGDATFTATWKVWDKVKTPFFNLSDGAIAPKSSLTITCDTLGAVIYYTTDGTEPATSVTGTTKQYSAAITISPPVTVKAIAVKEGMNNSSVATGVYTPFIATYKFTESVKTLTDYVGTAGSSGTYVIFGDWPQTLADSTVKFNENPETSGDGKGYYVGSDGNYYDYCLENAFLDTDLDGTDDFEVTYSDGTTKAKSISKASYKYFKVEPIKWRVVDTAYDYDGTTGTDTAKLLVAENILTGNVPYYECNNVFYTRTVETDTNIYPNNYKYSQIRAYLNGLDYYYDTSTTETTKITTYTSKGFLQSAFTDVAQQKIKTTTVNNKLESTGDDKNDYICDNTTDKIFLLSQTEVKTTTYFSDNNSRIRKTTDYAKANYAYQSNTDGNGGVWWLRTPKSNSHTTVPYLVRYVFEGGTSESSECVYYTYDGIVPALTISY